MQPLNWYFERVRSMSPAEIIWRVRSLLRNAADRPRFALNLYPSLPLVLQGLELSDIGPEFRLHSWDPGVYGSEQLRADEVEWQTHLFERAKKLLNHQISFFSLRDCHLGSTIDWNKDYE